MTKNSLLVYSGGMDSTVMLHEYADKIALAVTFVYGSKHNGRELAHAMSNCKRLGVEHVVIDLAFIGQHFTSDLLKSGGDVPDGHYEDQSMRRTVVPFRNGIMLAVAAGLAESRQLDYIMLANHAGDHAIYPDCRGEFIAAMDQAIKKGTYDCFGILAPYTTLTKREIAQRGHRIKVPFADTWSCYKGGDIHCGQCGTCVERKEALDGFDPTGYESALSV